MSRLSSLLFRKHGPPTTVSLSKEEMKQGIIILSCKTCNAATKHKVEGNRVQSHQLRLPVRRGGQIWYSHNPATCLVCGATYVMFRRKN